MIPRYPANSQSNSLAGANAVPSPLPGIDVARVTLVLAGTLVVVVAGYLGGMQYVIVALALALAVWVMREPREAVPAGWLFMLAAMIL
jgi:hypothetical protein